MPTTSSKKTTRELWMVEELKTGRSRWTRVGIAEETEDGTLMIRLQVTPVAGASLNLRAPPPVLANHVSQQSKAVADNLAGEDDGVTAGGRLRERAPSNAANAANAEPGSHRRSTHRRLYKVEAIDASGDWDDADWHEDDEPLRFRSIAEAKEEIRQFVAAAEESGMHGYSAADFRVVRDDERTRPRRDPPCAQRP